MFSRNTYQAIDNPSSTCSFCFHTLHVIVTASLIIGLFILSKQSALQSTQLNQDVLQLDQVKYELSQLSRDFNSFRSSAQFQLNDHNSRIPVIESKQNINVNRISDIQYSISNITSTISTDNNEIIILSKILSNHTNQLLKLSNLTSNNEVISQLKQTKIYVDTELLNTKKLIFDGIDVSLQNISAQTQNSMKELNNNLNHIQHYLDDAKSQIHAVKSNVTDQLTFISIEIQKNIDFMNIEVKHAEQIIFDQVSKVQDDIEIYVVATNKELATLNDFFKYNVAGSFAIASVLITLWHMYSHLHPNNYKKEDIQEKIVGVLSMVLVYVITAFLSLVFPQYEFEFSTVRNIWEAFVINAFVGMITDILKDEARRLELVSNKPLGSIEEKNELVTGLLTKLLREGNSEIRKKFKLTFWCFYKSRLSYRELSTAWLRENKVMVLQFVGVKLILTALIVILYLCNYDVPVFSYGDGSSIPAIHWDSLILYINTLEIISVSIALQGLFNFKHAVSDILKWCQSDYKFYSIKGIIFFTFWQGLLIKLFSICYHKDSKYAVQIQNLLICIEMLFASLIHVNAFPVKEWQADYRENIRISNTNIARAIISPIFVNSPLVNGTTNAFDANDNLSEDSSSPASSIIGSDNIDNNVL